MKKLKMKKVRVKKTNTLNKVAKQRRHAHFSSNLAKEGAGKRKLSELLQKRDDLYIIKGNKYYKLMLGGKHVGGCANPSEITTVFTERYNCFVKHPLDSALNEFQPKD